MFIWSSIAHLIALTSPGPDTAVTIRQVTLHGRNAGIYSAIGIGVGIYAHCLLAINGISLLVLSNELYKLIMSGRSKALPNRLFLATRIIALSVPILTTEDSVWITNVPSIAVGMGNSIRLS